MIIQTPTQQPVFQPHKKGYMVNFNERLVEVNIENETANWYEYDQIWVSELTIEAITVAIIRTRYTINDELKLGRQSKTSTEWKEYNFFVEAAIAKAHEILEENNG